MISQVSLYFGGWGWVSWKGGGEGEWGGGISQTARNPAVLCDCETHSDCCHTCRAQAGGVVCDQDHLSFCVVKVRLSFNLPISPSKWYLQGSNPYVLSSKHLAWCNTIAELTHNTFIHAKLTQNTLIHAKLTQNTFIHAKLTQNTLIHAKLTQNTLIHAKLTQNTLIHAKLTQNTLIHALKIKSSYMVTVLIAYNMDTHVVMHTCTEKKARWFLGNSGIVDQ